MSCRKKSPLLPLQSSVVQCLLLMNNQPTHWFVLLSCPPPRSQPGMIPTWALLEQLGWGISVNRDWQHPGDPGQHTLQSREVCFVVLLLLPWEDTQQFHSALLSPLTVGFPCEAVPGEQGSWEYSGEIKFPPHSLQSQLGGWEKILGMGKPQANTLSGELSSETPTMLQSIGQ